MKEHIKSTVKALAQVKMEKARCADHACPPPDRLEIVKVLHELQSLLFPMAFRRDYPDMAEETLLIRALYRLRDQLVAAMRFQDLQGEDPVKAADAICTGFAERLPEIKRLLLLDVEALYEGDPAAVCREEVMITYPGFRAICIFRIAHELYVLKAPLIPRIMTEYAHEKTGIDIHPGATVGEYFFIDHGTGIVIGETTVIGNHVKLYQGVTLGAKSFELDENGNPVKNIKRHPNIGNHVVIYANATILGGDTYIGDNSVIGGNTWLTRSVEAGSVVTYKGENKG